MVEELIQVKAPYRSTTQSIKTTKTIKDDSFPSTETKFDLEMLTISFEPIDEIQRWIADGRIHSYEMCNTWEIGQARQNRFFFTDPQQAVLFKLMFA
jgi:hypothetical protein